MLEEDVIAKERHEKFIEKVCATEKVWTLEKDNGYATATSIHYEDDNDEPVEVLCFWSEKDLAELCAKEDWEGFKPVEIGLAEFIENWCIGMANDLILAGSDFDQELFGHETDPLELILQLNDALLVQKKELNLQNHKSMNDLINEIKKILGE